MEQDSMQVTILADGTIKTVTDAVSESNHDSAEAWLRAVAKLAGGTTTREARKDLNRAHAHTHEHGHTHQH